VKPSEASALVEEVFSHVHLKGRWGDHYTVCGRYCAGNTSTNAPYVQTTVNSDFATCPLCTEQVIGDAERRLLGCAHDPIYSGTGSIKDRIHHRCSKCSVPMEYDRGQGLWEPRPDLSPK
jgi:hypothetical protein